MKANDRDLAAQWLMLIHQIPPTPNYLRVKIGRRLAQVGAIALKSSVYVLPKSDGTFEDFQWIRREITECGGDATVIDASLVEGVSDSDLEARFRDAKDAEYAAVIGDARKLSASMSRRKKALDEPTGAQLLTDVARLQRNSSPSPVVT